MRKLSLWLVLASLVSLPTRSHAQVYSPCGDWPYTPCRELSPNGKLPGWQGWDAAAVYGSGVLLDRLTTERFLRHGVAEGNPHGQSQWSRTGLGALAFGTYMGADYAAHRFVHPKAVWPLRIGIAAFYIRQGYINITVVR